MEQTYRIRRAVAEDIESVAALERGMATVPHWTVADYLAALALDDLVPTTAGTRRCLFVAQTMASLIVGFAVGRVTVLEAEVLAEVESVAVAETARRAGIGRALCDAVIGWASGQGAHEIELEVRSMSDGAIAMYSGMGFIETGRRWKYYRAPADDAVLMRRAAGPKHAQGAAGGRDL